MGNTYNNGAICVFFDQGFSSCSLNGSRCDCPFSKKGCEIQCEKIFHEKPEGEIANRYKANIIREDNIPLTKAEIFKRLNIKKGMMIADCFIPYNESDKVIAGLSVQIDYGIELIKEKLNNVGCNLTHLRIYHNVKIIGEVGIYIIGTGWMVNT